MAGGNVNQYLAAIRQKYPLTQVDQGLLTELQRRQNEGASVDQVLNDSAGYYQTQKTPFDIFQPVSDAAKAGFEARRTANTQDFNDTATRLRQEATNDTSALEERGNSLGLLRSGLTAAGEGKIQSDLSNNVGRADIQRAISDADLALKEAGFNADLSTQTLSLANSTNQNNNSSNLANSNFITQLLQSPNLDSIPDNILRQILQQLGYNVTD